MNAPTTPSRNPRYGLMMARIGTNHVIKNSDGVVRQFKVRDKSRHPTAKCVAVCLHCNQKFQTVEDLIADHPDEAILRKQQEKHVYVFWSEDPVDKTEKSDKDKKLGFDKILGLLSTEE